MTDRSEMYKSQSDFLKADDLPEGKEFELVIEGTDTTSLNNEEKLVVHFKGREKGLVLNATNYKRIANAFSHDDANWPGKKVLLYRDVTDYQGKEVPCLRVRIEAEKVTAEFQDDKIPF